MTQGKLKKVLIIGALMVILLFFAWLHEAFVLQKAHSTFENYSAFRGCTQLLERTDSYGFCKLKSGQTIKIVKFRGAWYLDKDLPICIFGVCI